MYADLKAQLENLLINHVSADLKNENFFLQFRALRTYRTFAGIHFNTQGHLSTVVDDVKQCLVSDKTPISLEAALCLKELLPKDEVPPLILNDLEVVLRKYLHLMSELDHDGLMVALTALVKRFQAEIAPSAGVLTQ